MIALLAALLSAAGFWFAHGLADAWPLAWIAPIPVLWLAFGEAKGWRVAMAAFAAYLIGQMGGLGVYWSDAGPILLVMAAVPALAFTAAVMLARLAYRRLPPLAAVLAFPSIWIAWEWGFSLISPNGSFGSWAYSQVGAPMLIQSASLFGLWALGFLIALVASAAAMAARGKTSPLILAGVLFAANLGFGAWRLNLPQGPAQPIGLAAKGPTRDDAPETARRQSAEARRLVALGARTVVFQEKESAFKAADRDMVLAPLAAAARETGATLVVGYDVHDGTKRFNTAYVITPDGRVATYVKRHHVPGLESMFTPGPGPGLLGRGRAVVICKDMDFARTLRADAIAGRADGGVRLMLVPAWDFGADGWAHGRMAIWRGVEGGYAVARSAADGLLTLSDSRGRVVARGAAGLGDYAAVTGELPLGDGPTPYLSLGDVFAWLSAALGAVLVLWAAVARKKG